jgi:hypothetical protein
MNGLSVQTAAGYGYTDTSQLSIRFSFIQIINYFLMCHIKCYWDSVSKQEAEVDGGGEREKTKLTQIQM